MSHAATDLLRGGISERDEELLLQCARWQIDTDSAARIASLTDEATQWDAARAAVRRHGIVPQFYAALRASPRLAPEHLLADLMAERDANTVRNLGMTAEVVRVLRAFDSSDVAALSYKGPALALQVYGSLAARQFGDLDILVRRHDLARARYVLGELGYTGDPWPNAAAEDVYIRRNHVHGFIGADGTRLELHWQFVPPELSVRLDVDEIWSRLEQGRLGDVQALSLAPEDLLLVLCVHGCRHVWARLKAVCDVAEVVLRLPLDWSILFERARSARAGRMFSLGVLLARDLLHVSLGSQVDSVLDTDPGLGQLTADVRHRLFGPSICQPVSAEARFFHARLREHVSVGS